MVTHTILRSKASFALWYLFLFTIQIDKIIMLLSVVIMINCFLYRSGYWPTSVIHRDALCTRQLWSSGEPNIKHVSSTVIGRKLKMYDVIISVLASQVVGALWYSPLFVGVPWSCLAFPGCNEKEIQTLLSVKTNYAYGVAFSSAVFLTLLLKFFFLTYVS